MAWHDDLGIRPNSPEYWAEVRKRLAAQSDAVTPSNEQKVQTLKKASNRLDALFGQPPTFNVGQPATSPDNEQPPALSKLVTMTPVAQNKTRSAEAIALRDRLNGVMANPDPSAPLTQADKQAWGASVAENDRFLAAGGTGNPETLAGAGGLQSRVAADRTRHLRQIPTPADRGVFVGDNRWTSGMKTYTQDEAAAMQEAGVLAGQEIGKDYLVANQGRRGISEGFAQREDALGRLELIQSNTQRAKAYEDRMNAPFAEKRDESGNAIATMSLRDELQQRGEDARRAGVQANKETIASRREAESEQRYNAAIEKEMARAGGPDRDRLEAIETRRDEDKVERDFEKAKKAIFMMSGSTTEKNRMLQSARSALEAKAKSSRDDRTERLAIDTRIKTAKEQFDAAKARGVVEGFEGAGKILRAADAEMNDAVTAQLANDKKRMKTEWGISDPDGLMGNMSKARLELQRTDEGKEFNAQFGSEYSALGDEQKKTFWSFYDEEIKRNPDMKYSAVLRQTWENFFTPIA